MNEKKSMIKAGGLWKNVTKDGKTYLSGNLGGLRVLIFPNSYKTEGSQEPDYILNFTENEKREDKPKPAAQDPFGFGG